MNRHGEDESCILWCGNLNDECTEEILFGIGKVSKTNTYDLEQNIERLQRIISPSWTTCFCQKAKRENLCIRYIQGKISAL